MKVSELIDKLSAYDSDCTVLVSVVLSTWNFNELAECSEEVDYGEWQDISESRVTQDADGTIKLGFISGE